MLDRMLAARSDRVESSRQPSRKDEGMMISRALLSVGLLSLAWACGSTPKPKPAEPEPEPAAEQPAPAASEEKSSTEGWSEAAPTTSTAEETEAPKRKNGRVIVKSDPKRHGDEIHFDFSVNGTRMDGVFVVPGGQTFTFTLPGGTVSYSVAECGGRGGGFELEAGSEMTLTCHKGGGGDCCGVAPKEVPGAKPAGGKQGKKDQKKAEPAAAE
jgi:hypothetical protein